MSTESERDIVKRLTGVDDSRIAVSETGWTSRVFLIDGGRVVFKFPRNAKFREESKHEVAVLKLLNGKQLCLSVPVLCWTTEDNAYFGYYGVEGRPLCEVIDSLSEQQKGDIGTQLGHFIQQLHGIKDYGNIQAQTLDEQAKEYTDRYHKGRDLLTAFFNESAMHTIDAFFAHEVPKSMTGSGELVFCHGDLDYNNTLINSKNQVGVIDFGDARLYDKSQDFRGMDDAVIREAMKQAYGGGEVISQAAAETSAKMIAVLDMIYCVEQNDAAGIQNSLERIRTKILHGDRDDTA